MNKSSDFAVAVSISRLDLLRRLILLGRDLALILDVVENMLSSDAAREAVGDAPGMR